MKTSLLVLSLLMASSNALTTAPAKPAADAAPKASDHKVDSPAHHVAAKADHIAKAAALKTPSPAHHDAAPAKDDDDVKCETPSCKAARSAKKEAATKEAAAAKPAPAEAHHTAKPKMEVVHKAEAKPVVKTPEVHTIKTRPAVKHTDPTTKAH